ncbi:MAG: hypothetical protein HUU37_03530, partial [Bdellovibrionales bacterium]|nr:hypothetical protein [Bdellovibrionales bacterium]
KAAKWRKLQKFNNKLIKDPNRIFAGFTLWYDITPKELAEAEQRRSAPAYPSPSSLPPQEKQVAEAPPSAINPPVEAAPVVSGQPNVAVAPPSEAPVIVDGAPAQPTAPRQ